MAQVTLTTHSPPSYSLSGLPEEVTFQIFIRLPKLNGLQSLLWTNKRIHQIVSIHFPLWNHLLEIRFPDSFKTISEKANSFEAFGKLQAAKYNMCDYFCIKRSLQGNKDELPWMKIDRGKLISTAKDCCIKIRDVKSEALEKSIPFIAGEITRGMVVYKDKLYLISITWPEQNYTLENYISDKLIRVYDLKKENIFPSGNEIALLKIPDLSTIKCLCAQGNLLFVGYIREYGVPGNFIKDYFISIWDMDTHKRIHTIKMDENDDEDEPWIENDEITCLAPSENTLYSGHKSGSILAWDLKDYKFLKKLGDGSSGESSPGEDFIFTGQSTEEKLEVSAMTVYKEQLIYARGRKITILDLIQGEKLCSLVDKEEVCRFHFTLDGLLAVSYGDQTKIVIWDLDARKKIWEKDGSNHLSSLAMHEGKLFIGFENKEIEVFDFMLPYQHEIKLLNALTNPTTEPERTKIHTELLLLAFAKKNRNKMIDCAAKLLAVDPLNIKFSEFLCIETEKCSSLEYQLNERVPFDYKTCLRYANSDQIAKALVDFTEWLGTERDIKVDSPFKVTADTSSSDEESVPEAEFVELKTQEKVTEEQT